MGQLRPRPVPRPGARRALRRGNGVAGARRAGSSARAWRSRCIATMAPGGHISHTTATLRPDGTYLPRGGHGRVRQRHDDRAPADRGDGARASVDRLDLRSADTDAVRHDTGAFASAGITGRRQGAARRVRRAARRACSQIAAASREQRIATTAASLPDGVRTPQGLVGFAAHRRRRAGRRALGRGARRHDGRELGDQRSLVVQRARGARRGRPRDRHGARPAVGPGRRRRLRPEPRAVPRADRGRRRAGHRQRAVRGGPGRGAGTSLNPVFRQYRVPQIADVPDDRGVLRRRPSDDLGPVRREVDERVAVQPGRAGHRQRDRASARHTRLRAAVHPRSGVAGAAGGVRDAAA